MFKTTKKGKQRKMKKKIIVYFSEMKAGIIIQVIEAANTHVVRHPVLRKGRPLESCIFDGDGLASTIHLGAYIGEKLVGVLSAYEKQHPAFDEKNTYQVRGVAVLKAHQANGIGRLLMHSIESKLIKKEVSLLWLNARLSAVRFYKNLGYKVEGGVFDLPLIGPHYCYYKTLP